MYLQCGIDLVQKTNHMCLKMSPAGRRIIKVLPQISSYHLQTKSQLIPKSSTKMYIIIKLVFRNSLLFRKYYRTIIATKMSSNILHVLENQT